MKKKPPIDQGKAFIPPVTTDFKKVFEPPEAHLVKKRVETNRTYTARESEIYLTGGIKADSEPAAPLCPDLFNGTAVGLAQVSVEDIPVLNDVVDTLPKLLDVVSDVKRSSILSDNPFETPEHSPPPTWKR